MSIFKILKSNQGLSIVEVLMAVGVLGIGALALVNLTQNTAKDTRSVVLNAVKAQYYNSFKEFINSKAGCDALEGKAFNTGYSNISIDSSKLPKLVREKYFDIKSIQGRRMNSLNELPVGNGFNSSIEVKLTLNVYKNSKKNTTSLSGTGGSGGSSGAGAGSGVASAPDQEIYYFIIPAILSSTTGQVLKCDVERTQDLACKAIGATLDSDNKCKADANCLFRGSYAVATGTGAVASYSEPNPVTQAYSCPEGATAIPTGSMSYMYQAAPSSKKGDSGSLISGSASFFSCFECPSGTPTTVGGSGGGGFSIGGGGGGPGLGSGSTFF